MIHAPPPAELEAEVKELEALDVKAEAAEALNGGSWIHVQRHALTRQQAIAHSASSALVKRVTRARTRYPDFAEFAMLDNVGVPLVLSTVHRVWHLHFEYCWSKGLIPALISMWGHGKSLSLVVGRLAYEFGQDLNLRAKIICQNDQKAMERVMGVSSLIRSSRYRYLFPLVRQLSEEEAIRTGKHRKWTQHEIYLARAGFAIDASLQAAGVLSAGTGGRCVLPSTLVFGSGGPEPIAGILEGDRVLDGSGRYAIVRGATMRRYSGEVVSFRVEGFNHPIETTLEHPVLVFRGTSAIWVRADALEKRDLVVLPRQKPCSTHKMFGVPALQMKAERLLSDDGMWRLFGYYIGNGWLKDPICTGRRGSSNAVWFAFNAAKDQAMADDVLALAARIGATASAKPRGPVLEVRITHPIVARLCRLFGSGVANKKIPPWAERASRRRQREFIRGFWRADGYSDEETAAIVNSNEKLLAQVHMMILSAGVGSRMQLVRKKGTPTRIKGRLCITQGLWVVGSSDPTLFDFLGIALPKKTRPFQRRQIFLPNHVLLPIAKLSRRLYDGNVYDISVPTTRSFAAYGALLHNCDLMLFDDIVDQRNAVDEPLLRGKVIDNVDRVWSQRVEPSGRMGLIGQNWHEADMTFEIEKRKAWCVLKQRISEGFDAIDQEVHNAPDDYPLPAHQSGRRALARRILVESSAIKAFSYVPLQRALEIEFTQGAAWIYEHVPPELVDAFEASRSKGAFYTAEVKGRYPARRRASR